MAETLYWHDYETWGADPKRDRPSQFAGIRTDLELNIVSQPFTAYCAPAMDVLPQPEACLVTGITPQRALAEGVNEAEFFAMIHGEFAKPGTCGVGYNSVRFDDEFTRYGLYRNFYDPYGREWQNGNSRWDIIDMVRLTHALRPEGIEWPQQEGIASFRLELLTAANGISHEAAHDAMSDVYATLEMAKLVRKAQPKLFDYLFKLRNKRQVAQLLHLQSTTPVLHVTSMYPANRGCIAQVVPVAQHPTNPNGVIVYDLAEDPSALLRLTPEQIAGRLFTKAVDLPDGVERIPLKTIHINKCPAVVPLNTLTEKAAERWSIDVALGQQHLQVLRNQTGLEQKIQAAFSSQSFAQETDPDLMLYSGGFFSRNDRAVMDQMLMSEPNSLANICSHFDDSRIAEMLFRYRARNWPGTLGKEENVRWDEYRKWRLTSADGGASIQLPEFQKALATKMVDPALSDQDREVLSKLADWPEQLGLC